MRKQNLLWIIAVFGIVGSAYGGYLLIYHLNHGNGLSLPALFLLIFGALALIIFLGTYIPLTIIDKKKRGEPTTLIEEKKPFEEQKVTEEKAKPTAQMNKVEQHPYIPKQERVSYSSSRYDSPTVYIKKVGYGPIMRVENGRILDMRNSTYYRFEGNMLMQEGYGPVYEIRGNQIKNAFGGFLYELSGSNINKVFGGFYASISGNHITLYDLSVKYEMTGSLTKNQILAVAVLLFYKY